MSKSIPPEVIEKTLKGIAIPSRPQVLVHLHNELAKDDPDPRVITRLISGDVGLSAAVLKTVNSPFFGLSRRMSSVAQAVSLLGMRSATQIVTGLLLKSAIAAKPAGSLERFWDSAEKVAGIASHIAMSIPQGPRDEAYCFGLFHDIGIAILMQKFPDYRQTLEMAEQIDRPITALEEERHATDHATLGYLVAKGWFLPEVICDGILYHHDPSVFDDREVISSQALTLIAINALAEHFHDEYLHLRHNSNWQRMGDRALDQLGLREDEYCDLREDLTKMAG